MKAYQVWDIENYEGYQDVVFAENAKAAKTMGFGLENCSGAEWINMRVRRLPELDGMEDYTHKELMYELIKLGWWYEHEGVRYTEEDLDLALGKGYVKKR